MKKYLRYFLLLIIVGGVIYFVYKKIQEKRAEAEHQAFVASLVHTATKNVTILKDTIEVDYLKEKRSLGIYLPPNYHQDSIDYPVIYFLDGQSLFDRKINEGSEWRVDEVLDSLSLLGQPEAIVVGVYNADDRLKEYKPFPSDRMYSDKTVSGDKHADWIVRMVKPFIDQRFRTKKDTRSTTIGGASLGGLMSYYMIMEYPDIFGNAIVFSPSFWVHEKVYKLHEGKDLSNKKIFFNAGRLETPTVESIEKMQKILLADGMPAKNIELVVEEGLGHWHLTWEKGIPKVYPWIIEPI